MKLNELSLEDERIDLDKINKKVKEQLSKTNYDKFNIKTLTLDVLSNSDLKNHLINLYNQKLFEDFMDFTNMIFRSSYYEIYEVNSSIIDAYVNIMECPEEDKKILEEFFLNKKGE